MHDRHVVTGGVGSASRTGVGKTGFFLDWQRVHVGAHEHGWAAAIAQAADHAGAANSIAHLIPPSA